MRARMHGTLDHIVGAKLLFDFSPLSLGPLSRADRALADVKKSGF